MTGWNYADVLETIAEIDGDAAAIRVGDRTTSWQDLDRRADAIAALLLERGVAQGDRIALYLYNLPEYIESAVGALKIGLVPVNTNYRYLGEELRHVWDDSGAVAVVFAGSFTDQVDSVRDRTTGVGTWLWVDDATHACPEWAIPVPGPHPVGPARTVAPWGRSGDDRIFIYTGGTTGAPSGVVWRQDDMYRVYNAVGDPEIADLDAVADRVRSNSRPVGLAAPPLMHSTGILFALTMLVQGGCVVLSGTPAFDAVAALDAIDASGADHLAIVGDAFARPLLAALDAEPERWNVSGLRVVVSSGVMWSHEVKEGLQRHLPATMLVDLLGSTEAYGVGAQVHGGGEATTGRFTLGERALVITPDGRVLEPGDGEPGLLALSGPGPVGYHNDPEKTARTFREIEGQRVAVTGDWATIDGDGTITLLGRGSGCINTGGEKVFAEEVEESLKTHPKVNDALVVGLPSERFGEQVCAVVSTLGGQTEPTPDELMAYCRSRLAGYKAPRRIVVSDAVPRTPNGKADYSAVRRLLG